ncbi:hypothetical protein SERLADRAFT_372343 [Serpula lacrymans var. lacrymans S7.9]|uniref:Uncharacterized protein n=1 Tax=Serpula lacrymans var. lacrymans (strain S7.9) TaxID=578457 RepID=F8P515_SERL9|nr:uncharacterized protein SERLADRAFT_372343 [Serpula lacrymans var. lacrymans S7.9]EGO21702.1 hypothetical protein SERLADRAFT_372343 [Serpula lacrymans var. lacrymans S7.9]
MPVCGFTQLDVVGITVLCIICSSESKNMYMETNEVKYCEDYVRCLPALSLQ